MQWCLREYLCKLLSTVITQKKKTLTFSECKVCLSSYLETEPIWYPQDESDNILQMMTTFGKINQRNKPWVSMHSHYDYKSTNYNYNNNQKPQHTRADYKIPPPPLPQRRQILFVTFVGGGGDTNHLTVEIEGKVIFVII